MRTCAVRVPSRQASAERTGVNRSLSPHTLGLARGSPTRTVEFSTGNYEPPPHHTLRREDVIANVGSLTQRSRAQDCRHGSASAAARGPDPRSASRPEANHPARRRGTNRGGWSLVDRECQSRQPYREVKYKSIKRNCKEQLSSNKS